MKILGSEKKRHLIDRVIMDVGIAVGFGAASFLVHNSPVPMFFTSLGATTCILFTAPDSKAAAWWRILASHTLCAAVGITARLLLGRGWIPCAVCVTLAIAIMDALDIVHPPAAATSLVGFTSSEGYMLALSPVLAGMATLVVCGKTTIYILNAIMGRKQKIVLFDR